LPGAEAVVEQPPSSVEAGVEPPLDELAPPSPPPLPSPLPPPLPSPLPPPPASPPPPFSGGHFSSPSSRRIWPRISPPGCASLWMLI